MDTLSMHWVHSRSGMLRGDIDRASLWQAPPAMVGRRHCDGGPYLQRLYRTASRGKFKGMRKTHERISAKCLRAKKRARNTRIITRRSTGNSRVRGSLRDIIGDARNLDQQRKTQRAARIEQQKAHAQMERKRAEEATRLEEEHQRQEAQRKQEAAEEARRLAEDQSRRKQEQLREQARLDREAAQKAREREEEHQRQEAQRKQEAAEEARRLAEDQSRRKQEQLREQARLDREAAQKARELAEREEPKIAEVTKEAEEARRARAAAEQRLAEIRSRIEAADREKKEALSQSQEAEAPSGDKNTAGSPPNQRAPQPAEAKPAVTATAPEQPPVSDAVAADDIEGVIPNNSVINVARMVMYGRTCEICRRIRRKVPNNCSTNTSQTETIRLNAAMKRFNSVIIRVGSEKWCKHIYKYYSHVVSDNSIGGWTNNTGKFVPGVTYAPTKLIPSTTCRGDARLVG